jgi:DNA-binding NtrC family response regulator
MVSNKTQFLSVVDDEEDIMCLFRDALTHLPEVEVVGFTDSHLAFDHFKQNQENYNLVLTDYRMPALDGMELLKKVKSINSSVKTILISAYAMNDEDFEQCGCVDAFLQKPISIPDLIDAVETQTSTS